MTKCHFVSVVSQNLSYWMTKNKYIRVFPKYHWIRWSQWQKQYNFKKSVAVFEAIISMETTSVRKVQVTEKIFIQRIKLQKWCYFKKDCCIWTRTLPQWQESTGNRQNLKINPISRFMLNSVDFFSIWGKTYCILKIYSLCQNRV